jgi:DNA-binding FadR family transcriptional regulator
LAATVAARIVEDVFERQWPVGEVIGSEAELVDRYGVSRAVFREAVRLVEHQHVARMRRGPGGGLVVTEPDDQAVVDAAVMYLLRVGARLDEVFEARLVLEEAVTALAATRIRGDDLARVRDVLDAEAGGLDVDPRRLHSVLASATGNRVLELFVETLNRVAAFYFSDRRAVTPHTESAVANAHRRIAEAVIAGDGAVGRRRMRAHLDAEADYIRNRRGSRQVLTPGAVLHGPDGSKRAEEIAREIFGAVMGERLSPGDLIGSEPGLMESYDVSRAVFREAVRILEHHHVASMRRGPGGGLYVVPPSVTPVAEVATVYLRRRGVRPADVDEVRTIVAAVPMAGNRALELVTHVVSRLGLSEHASEKRPLISPEAAGTPPDPPN